MTGQIAGKRPRQARAERTRDLLLDTAARMFDEKGWSGTSTNAIARESGVSVGGLYEWFSSKEDILVGLAERHLVELGAAVEPIIAAWLESRPPLAEALRRLITAVADIHAAHPALHRLLYAEAPRTAGVLALSEKFEERMVGLLTSFPPFDLHQDGRLRARILFRAAEALLHSVILDDTLDIPLDRRIEEVVRLCTRYAISG